MNGAVMSSGVVDYDRELVYTMDETLTMVGFGKFQALVLAYAGLGSMADAMELMILSFIGPSVRSEWGLSSRQESLITTVVFAGMLIGSYALGLISDNYGRRMGLLSIAAATSIFAVLSAFSPNYISLIIFRMVVGVGLGGGPVYSSWFLEFVPVRNRGVWMVVFATFSTIGTIFEASLAWIVMPRLGWRWLLALSSVPCLAAFILYIFTEESPRYLYVKGRIADAHNVLKKMASTNKTQLPPGILVSDQIRVLDEELTTPEGTALLSTIKNKSTCPKPGIFSFFTLLSSSLIKTTLLLWVVYLTNSFLYYGVVLMTSEFSSSQSKCGALVLHSNQPTDTSLYRNVFITSFAELPGLILSAILVDKVGFIFLLPLMFHQNELLTTSLLFGARMCFIGNFKIAGIYCPEIYPTSMRTTGAGVAAAVGKIGGMVCPLVAVELVSGCHRMAAIASFEVVMVLSAICVLLFKVETKGRELHDTVDVHN
ncbi:UNVERIFIED_CONTAM: Organic cation/carnitine transporter 7 [Sesamum radiatum]|uniref:Organic cation/carnitine transporter 7 n=1 Tax=Sesamum radiatum TaxID=300843 RepID=A0AAW2R3Y3_SESRA